MRWAIIADMSDSPEHPTAESVNLFEAPVSGIY